MKSSICSHILLVIVAAIFISGCSFKQSINDISQVNMTNEVIIVGNVEIDPKIEKDDVSVKRSIGGGDLYRTFVMRIGEDVGETTDYVRDLKHSAVVNTDQDFYLPFDRNEGFKMFGGYFYTQFHDGFNRERATVFYKIRGGIEVQYPKNATAVYIGTIRFKRDEFFNLKDISFSQDGYEAAQKRFQEKFKSNIQLVKGKITKVGG